MANTTQHHRQVTVQADIWGIAWPRPASCFRPTAVIMTRLGTEGAWVQPSQRWPVGTTLELCFPLPGFDLEVVCGAVVKDVTAWGRIAVAFTVLDLHDRKQLTKWVTASQHADECRDVARSVS